MLPLIPFAIFRFGSGGSDPLSPVCFFSLIGTIALYYGIRMFISPIAFIKKKEHELAWLESLDMTDSQNIKRQNRIEQIRYYLCQPNLIKKTQTNGRTIVIVTIFVELAIWSATFYGRFGNGA